MYTHVYTYIYIYIYKFLESPELAIASIIGKGGNTDAPDEEFCCVLSLVSCLSPNRHCAQPHLSRPIVNLSLIGLAQGCFLAPVVG